MKSEMSRYRPQPLFASGSAFFDDTTIRKGFLEAGCKINFFGVLQTGKLSQSVFYRHLFVNPSRHKNTLDPMVMQEIWNRYHFCEDPLTLEDVLEGLNVIKG